MSQPTPRLKQQNLVDLAGHRRVAHVVPVKIADGATEAGQAAPAEMVAHFGQLRIGVAAYAQAIGFVAGAAEGRGHDQRIASPSRPEYPRGGAAAASCEHLHYASADWELEIGDGERKTRRGSSHKPPRPPTTSLTPRRGDRSRRRSRRVAASGRCRPTARQQFVHRILQLLDLPT